MVTVARLGTAPMTHRFGLRSLLGILAALVAAIAVFVITGDVTGALVALVGGIVVVLLMMGAADTNVPAPADTEAVPPSAQLAPVLEAIVEPVLVIANGRV